MKARIEADLARRGRDWGEIKSGAGSIRDIEFVTQFLQLAYGDQAPQIRSINTLDGLVRLADFSWIHADEYRRLVSAYSTRHQNHAPVDRGITARRMARRRRERGRGRAIPWTVAVVFGNRSLVRSRRTRRGSFCGCSRSDATRSTPLVA